MSEHANPEPERASFSGVYRRPCSCMGKCLGAEGLALGFYCEVQEAEKPPKSECYRIRKPMLWWSDGKDGRARFRTEIEAGEICRYHNGVFVFTSRQSFDGERVCPWLSRYVVEHCSEWFFAVNDPSKQASPKCENCGQPATHTGEFCEGDESGGRVPVCLDCARTLKCSGVHQSVGPASVEQAASDAAKICWNCTHWDMDEKRPSRGHCELFDKMTASGHGEQCTAFEK